MPHLETAHDVVKHLVTAQVPASSVLEGDILIAQGQVILVSKIEVLEYGPLKFILFDRVTCSDGEYERGISCKPNESVTIVARCNLKPTGNP